MDEIGFDALAAAWIHDRQTGKWCYLLSTPMILTKGPIWIYERLARVFRHRPLPPGVSPLDITVIDPALELALFGSPAIAVSGTPPGVRIVVTIEISIEHIGVTDGFAAFFRRVPLPLRAKKKHPSRTFDHKVKRLEAA
jgi:hypothetical protein